MLHLRTGERAGGANADDDQPNTEEPEEDAEQRSGDPVNEADHPDTLLRRLLKKNRADPGDDRIDKQCEDRSGDERERKVRRVDQAAQNRQQQTSAKQSRGIGGQDRSQPDQSA